MVNGEERKKKRYKNPYKKGGHNRTNNGKTKKK